MKNIFLILFLTLSLPAFSQQLYPLKKPLTDSLKFRLDAEDGKWKLKFNKPLDRINRNNEFPAISNIRIDDGDFIIDYELEGTKKIFTLQVEGQILAQNGTPLSELLRKESSLEENRSVKEQLAWKDATEFVLDYGQSYTLLIKRILLSELNCEDERPEFKMNKQWPHYLVAAAGIGMLGVGQAYVNQKKDSYDTYQRLWEQGESWDLANDFLEDAQSKEKTAKALTYAGWGILAADALVFIYRSVKIKKKQKLYDDYCGKNKSSYWRLSPSVDYAVGRQSVGGKLVFKF